MPDYTALLPPGLALLLIVRRGMKPTRIKPNRLWVYPAIITLLVLTSLSHAKAPDPLTLAIYAAVVVAGGVLGWFTTQHIELTLDEKTGTVMSQPSLFGTAVTVAVFGARFALDYVMQVPSGKGMSQLAVQHGASLALLTNAGLLFVAARGLSRAWHMWARIQPLLAQHKASQ
ncbi:MAG: hypothetical protein WDM91_05315 [Rhizomicrobium sp.]